jgi:precorrin isomerase/sulfite reductase beta subunit-like hemoprotein
MTADQMIKGWCPTTRKPMPSGDGLLMRLKPEHHRLTIEQVGVICDMADQLGSSLLSFTNRANLQIRGLSEPEYDQLITSFISHQIIPEDTPLDEELNLMVSPFYQRGDLTCQLAGELRARVGELPALPSKFGFAIDLGKVAVLRPYSADIRLERYDDDQLILLADGAFSGVVCSAETAIDQLIALCHFYIATKRGMQRRMARFVKDGMLSDAWQIQPRPENSDEHAIFAPSDISYGDNQAGQLVGIALGRIEAGQLKSALLASGASAIRLTPSHLILLEGVTGFHHEYLITDKDDPWLKMKACAGAPYCASAFIDTTQIASLLASTPAELIHISGCAKGCAHTNRADISVIGQDDQINVIRGGYAWDDPILTPVPLDQPEQILDRLAPDKPEDTQPPAEDAEEDSEIPAIYHYEKDGAAIYTESFAIIRSEAALSGFTPEEEQVAVRMIHAAGMVELAPFIRFSPDFVSAARTALNDGAPIFCDARMVSEGITRARLPQENQIICTLHDDRTRPLALEMGNTRSAAALELWRPQLAGALVAIGNAPTALFHLLNMLKQPDCPRPAAIIGCPVGFVGAAESKQALAQEYPVPFCIVDGRLGGSAITVAAINAVASTKE